MDENSNPPPAEQTPREPKPNITLFGKRMGMIGDEGTEAAPLPSDSDAEPRNSVEPDREERRIFWTVAATFLAVFVLVFGGLWLLRGRSGGNVAEAPPAPAVTAPAPAAITPAPAAAAPEAVPAKPRRLPPYEDAEPQPAKPAAAKPRPPGPRPAPAARKPASGKPVPAAVRRPAPAKVAVPAAPAADREYLRRLREEQEQYERDKKAGRYREFPQ